MKKKIIEIFSLLLIVIAYLILNKYHIIYIPCLVHEITGLYCPGCGVTRMIINILNGNFYQAFRYNPLLFISIPFFILYFLDLIISKVKNKKMVTELFEPHIWYILIGIFIIYGILRNIPYFDYLKPTLI